MINRRSDGALEALWLQFKWLVIEPMNNQQLGKDETGEKKGGGYGRGEGAKVNLQAFTKQF